MKARVPPGSRFMRRLRVAAPWAMFFSDTPVLPAGSNEAGGAARWRPRPVLAIRPGLSAFTVMLPAAQRTGLTACG